MLHQQGIPEQFQHPFSVPPGSSVVCQLFRERLDDLEHLGHLAFVMGKLDALGQHVRNHKKSLQRHVPQLNRSARLYLILGLAGDNDGHGFLLKAREPPADPGLQPFQEAAFVLGRNADQHRDAVAEQDGDAGLANPDRERDRRQGSPSKPIVLMRSPTFRACAITRVPGSAEITSGLIITRSPPKYVCQIFRNRSLGTGSPETMLDLLRFVPLRRVLYRDG